MTKLTSLCNAGDFKVLTFISLDHDDPFGAQRLGLWKNMKAEFWAFVPPVCATENTAMTVAWMIKKQEESWSDLLSLMNLQRPFCSFALNCRWMLWNVVFCWSFHDPS